MLEVRSLNQYYGDSHTLWDINLTVPAKQCICLVGRNGVGKTTLLNCITGLISTESGSISFGGHSIDKSPPESRAARGIGYVPQGRQIFPLLTVEENLRVGMAAQSAKRKRIPQMVFDLFPVLDEMRGRRGGDLSGGQQQQLAIGRALTTEPSLLILDEPTEGIQPNIVQQIADVITRLQRDMGMTVLLVEQKLAFVRQVAQQFCLLDRGRNVGSGTIDELDDNLIKQYLTV